MKLMESNCIQRIEEDFDNDRETNIFRTFSDVECGTLVWEKCDGAKARSTCRPQGSAGRATGKETANP